MKLKEIVLLSSLVIITGCMNMPKSLTSEGLEMTKEETKIYVDKLPIQTYEEYLALNTFVLDKYLDLEEDSRGEVFLRDGTEIKYTIDDEFIYEVITNNKKPFLETYKGFYIQNKRLKIFSQTIDDIEVGEEKQFNHLGGLEKLVDHDQKLKKDGMEYRKVLAWADNMDFLDLERVKVLKGESFSFQMHPLDDELIEIFKKNKKISSSDLKKFLKFKYVWSYIIERDGGGEYYYVSGDAEAYSNEGFIRYMI